MNNRDSRCARFCLARSTTLYPRDRNKLSRKTSSRVANDKSKGGRRAATRRVASRRVASRRAPSIFVRRTMRCATRRLAACDATRGWRAVPEVDQVNQKIARHTQNSAAQWNLNSARAVELNSLRNPVRPTTPRALPSFPFLFLSLVASYSLSFVIRKQTERRSCQVGGVGDETAVSVRPSFFRLRRRPVDPTGVYNLSYLTSFARSLPQLYPA